jgi:hypothetical protein
MKKIGILSVMAFALLSFTSCGGGETAGKTDGDSTATANNVSTPPVDPNNPAAPTEPVIDLPVTTVSFDAETHDFKEIKAGAKVVHEFKFKNTGTNPLKIYNVKPSCGCTTPDWTREPVAPGAEGFIKVEFDSAGKNGIQKKSVTVTMNTEPKTKVLNFQGEVLGDPNAAPAGDGHGH